MAHEKMEIEKEACVSKTFFSNLPSIEHIKPSTGWWRRCPTHRPRDFHPPARCGKALQTWAKSAEGQRERCPRSMKCPEGEGEKKGDNDKINSKRWRETNWLSNDDNNKINKMNNNKIKMNRPEAWGQRSPFWCRCLWENPSSAATERTRTTRSDKSRLCHRKNQELRCRLGFHNHCHHLSDKTRMRRIDWKNK